MFVRKPRKGHPDFFVSAKTLAPIPARHPALRAALVQASLDTQVRTIGFVASAHVASVPVETNAVVVVRDAGRFHLDVVPARPLRDLEEEGLFQLALRELALEPYPVTIEDLKAEPRRSNVDLVWSYNGRPVPLDLRMRILGILIDDGPFPLGHLLKGIRSDRDPTAAVMSLACSNLIELDLISQPIGPATMVKSRT